MKYEMIFGDEKLFDGAPDHVEVLRFNDYSKEYLWGDLNTAKLLTFKELKAIPIVAMRRIIKTPVWTVADQQAGRLPPIGSKYLTGGDKREFTCLFHSKGNGTVSVIGFNSDDEVSGYQIQYCHPIETPDEKAARLRSEWVSKAFSLASSESYVLELQTIYDALLSGELPPVQAKDGA